jgi:hypothetical protein
MAPLGGGAQNAEGHVRFRLTCLPSRGSIHVNMGTKKNPAAVVLGKLGGAARAKRLTKVERTEIARKGGAARAKKLSATERKRIAMLGVKARLAKRKGRS